jgi:uncharacterized protein YqjF (DUF2071 family)
MASPFLTAEWRKLAMANYVVDPTLVEPYLPPKIDIDLWKGQCYVSLVAFMFIDTRIKGVKIPFHVNFEEINLRFYVRNVEKRGVVFIKELVNKPAVSFIANTIYKESYETLPIEHTWIATPDTMNVEYRWKKGDWNVFRVSSEKMPRPIEYGSEQDFITNNYWGYTCHGKNCRAYEVQHRPWDIYNVKSFRIDVDFGRLYGERFTHLAKQKPASVFLAEGSPISILNSRRI